MNSALKASAISRASVVLPTPGGPHRIIECGLPGGEGDRQRLARRRAGAAARSRRRWLPGAGARPAARPVRSARTGRSRQASCRPPRRPRLGVATLAEAAGQPKAGPAKRMRLAPLSTGRHLTRRRRRRPAAARSGTARRRARRIALEVGEHERGQVAEACRVSSIRARQVVAEADAHALEPGLGRPAAARRRTRARRRCRRRRGRSSSPARCRRRAAPRGSTPSARSSLRTMTWLRSRS